MDYSIENVEILKYALVGMERHKIGIEVYIERASNDSKTEQVIVYELKFRLHQIEGYIQEINKFISGGEKLTSQSESLSSLLDETKFKLMDDELPL